MLSNEALNLLLGTSTPGGCFDLSLLEENYGSKCEFGSDSPVTHPAVILYRSYTHVRQVLLYKSPNFGRGGKVRCRKKEKGIQKGERGKPFS